MSRAGSRREILQYLVIIRVISSVCKEKNIYNLEWGQFECSYCVQPTQAVFVVNWDLSVHISERGDISYLPVGGTSPHRPHRNQPTFAFIPSTSINISLYIVSVGLKPTGKVRLEICCWCLTNFLMLLNDWLAEECHRHDVHQTSPSFKTPDVSVIAKYATI